MVKSSPKMLEVDPETGRVFEEMGETAETLQADQDKNFDDIVNEFEASDDNVTYRASINRVPDGYKKGGKEEWCFDVDGAEITGVRLKMRDEYGPGIYRVRVFKNKKQVRQFDYYIAKPTLTRPVASSNDNAALNAMAEQIRVLSENQTKLMERLLSGNQQNNQPDPFLMMERMSVVMKNLTPERAAAPTDNSFTMKDGMELFTKGMEIAGDFKSSGEESWLGVFKEIAKQLPVGELLQRLTEAQQVRNNPQMQQHRALPNPNEVAWQRQQVMRQNPIPPQPNPNNATAPDAAAATGQQLEQSMRYLIGRAQKNSDPALYADWLLDNAPVDLIRQMAHDPNVLVQLAAIFPRLNEPLIRAWFAELIEATKEALAENPEMRDSPAGIAPQDGSGTHVNGGGSHAPDPGRGAGDQDHPQDHAGIGQAGQA